VKKGNEEEECRRGMKKGEEVTYRPCPAYMYDIVMYRI
jgi:hypothetical protein